MDADSIVLATTEHAESDLIVTFFCGECGLLPAIAKGAKKSKKRFVNKLEPFTFLRISYDKKPHASLAFLREAELHSAFLNIRKNANFFGIASIICEFLQLAIREGEPEQKLFKLSLWSFHNLDQNKPPKNILALFLIKYLDYIGYRPELVTCGSCNRKTSQQYTYRFNTFSGRLICGPCSGKTSSGHPISIGTIKMMQTAQEIPLERLHRVTVSGMILNQTLSLLHNFSRQIFQREIVSWKVLQQF